MGMEGEEGRVRREREEGEERGKEREEEKLMWKRENEGKRG